MSKINIELIESLDSQILENLAKRENIKNKISDDLVRKILKNINKISDKSTKIQDLLKIVSTMNSKELSLFLMSFEAVSPSKFEKTFQEMNFLKNNDTIVLTKKIEFIQKIALIKMIFSEENINEINRLIKNSKI